METINPVVKSAYQALLSDLERIASEKAQARLDQERLRELEIRLDRDLSAVQSAINALEPLIGLIPSTEDIRQEPIRWRSLSAAFLKERSGMWFTSPAILDFILPDSNSIDKAERRKRMTNLSIALGALVEEEGSNIESTDNENGRGLLYRYNVKTPIEGV